MIRSAKRWPFSKLPKSQQMDDSLRRILAQPPEVAMVKLADRITNLAPPPAHWDATKISKYRAEAEEILRTLGAASAFLSARFRERLARYPNDGHSPSCSSPQVWFPA